VQSSRPERALIVLLCHCHRVSDSAVETLIDAGAEKVGQIVRATRAGTDCGGCIPALREACHAMVQRRASAVTSFADAVSA
jgi:bacterioferritin-associated ferredoxin